MIKINNKNKKSCIIVALMVIFIIFFLVIFNLKEENGYLNSVDSIKFVINENIAGNEIQEENNILNEKIKIHILGQVRYNGIIELEIGSRISAA